MSSEQLTLVAPSEGSSGAEIRRSQAILGRDTALIEMIEQHPTATVLLGGDRQIVYANRHFRWLAQRNNFLEQRIGEALKCVNLRTAPGGCGTSEACGVCTANRTIRACQQLKSAQQDEFRFTGEDGSLEFRIAAYPVHIGGQVLTAVALEDIGPEKRRCALERTFFHDVLNTAGGLSGPLQFDHIREPGRRRAQAL